MCAAAAELEHSCGPGLPRTLVPVGMNARIVVGEGPAALEAVRAYREAGPGGDVVLVSADEHLPYNRPPLSKDFVRGESEEEALPLEERGFITTTTLRSGSVPGHRRSTLAAG